MKDCNCIFCKIANGEIPSSTVYEDEDFRVILDLGPAAKGHALILPKEHFKDVTELDPKIAAKVLPLGAKLGTAMKKSLGCAGFNLVQNNGEAAGQTVFHFHVHVIPRYEGGPVIAGWEPGKTAHSERSEVHLHKPSFHIGFPWVSSFLLCYFMTPSPFAMIVIKSWTFVTIVVAERLPRSISLFTTNSSASTV